MLSHMYSDYLVLHSQTEDLYGKRGDSKENLWNDWRAKEKKCEGRYSMIVFAMCRMLSLDMLTTLHWLHCTYWLCPTLASLFFVHSTLPSTKLTQPKLLCYNNMSLHPPTSSSSTSFALPSRP